MVAINDAMGQILWTRHFLVAQGIAVPTITIYQDNKSMILLAENGMTSSSKSTKHLDVWYFFVMDKIKNGEVKVEYCPSGFFHKAATRRHVCAHALKILNLPSNTSATVHRSVLNKQNYDKQNHAANGSAKNEVK